MKKTAKKGVKKTSVHQNFRHFGIDIYHIALGVGVLGCVVAFLLLKEQQAVAQSTEVLAAQNSISIVVPPTCIPRPPCLDAVPRCLIPEPRDGWCPSTGTGTPIPSVTPPQGCFYKTICMGIACPAGDNCNSCRKILVCQSGVPFPNVSCVQRPPCQAGKACPAANPTFRWCPQTTSIPSSPGLTGVQSGSTLIPTISPVANTFIPSQNIFARFLQMFFGRK